MEDKDLKELRNDIRNWENVTIAKLKQYGGGHFYSDITNKLWVSSPEDVCKVIKEDYNLDVTYIKFDGKYIIFNEGLDFKKWVINLINIFILMQILINNIILVSSQWRCFFYAKN